jgi:hypothetical protein
MTQSCAWIAQALERRRKFLPSEIRIKKIGSIGLQRARLPQTR